MTRLLAVAAVLATLAGSASLAAEAATRPDPKTVTHQLIIDEPWYAHEPSPGAAPDGVLKKGTRVSIVADAGRYSQVWTADGSVKGYVSTGSMRKISTLKGKGKGSEKAP